MKSHLAACSEGVHTTAGLANILIQSLPHFPGSFGPTFCADVCASATDWSKNHHVHSSYTTSPSDILPISCPAALAYIQARILAENLASVNGAVAVFTLVLRGLNFLYGACAPTSGPEVLTSSQADSVLRIWLLCVTFLGLDLSFTFSAVCASLADKAVNYQGEVVSRRRDLVAAQVLPAWPAQSYTCQLPVADFVTEELRDDLLCPSRCLLDKSMWPKVTPRSKVHATDSEWYSLVKAGVALGLFAEVAEADIFRDQHGALVLNGAMGVDKYKMVDGVEVHLLRFISIFVPINSFMRRLRGDSDFLPYLNQLGSYLLGPDDELIVDSEDMESCFNLFQLPEAWKGFCAFSKQVPRSAWGGPASEMGYVCIRSVPMGWVGAVDLMQNMARRLVFSTCGVHPSTEMRKDKGVPPEDVAVVCMDGFDFLRRVPLGPDPEACESPEHAAFVETCARLNIPLNAGKSLVSSAKAQILGGEFDGKQGALRHNPTKGHQLFWKSVALATQAEWSLAAVQHWAGLACFAAGFRRPIFSVLQEVFTFITDARWDTCATLQPPAAVVDEVLVFCSLLPLCFSNLRAPIWSEISCSDASERGGGAGIASRFTGMFAPGVADRAEASAAVLVEESCRGPDHGVFLCQVCQSSHPVTSVGWTSCFYCHVKVCGLKCVLTHQSHCGPPIASLGKFGEGFGDGHGKLSLCVSSLGVGVLTPFRESLRKHDTVDAGLDPPSCFFEHWTLLRDRMPVHSHHQVEYGRQRVFTRRLCFCLERLKQRLTLGGVCVVELSASGFAWECNDLWHCIELAGVFCTTVEFANSHVCLVHNCFPLHRAFLDVGVQTVATFLVRYASVVEKVSRSSNGSSLPIVPSARQEWLCTALRKASNRLGAELETSSLLTYLVNMVGAITIGQETEHLHEMLRMADYRGSDVRIDSQVILDHGVQVWPYPAFVWDWSVTQSYPWKYEQHINVLEFAAFLNFLRSRGCDCSFQRCRFFHVFDSRVVSCVVAKGRSSSRLLNRLSRKVCSLLLASDVYVLPLWTISGWNFADEASRQFDHG